MSSDFESVIAVARSLFPRTGLSCVSDAGFLQPHSVTRDGKWEWNGLFGFESSVIRRHARETGNVLLDRLADFHSNKYPQWSVKRPHTYQYETFAEFLARDGKPVVLSRSWRWKKPRFIEVDSIPA